MKKTDTEKRWAVLTELQGSLQATEIATIHAYWVKVVWGKLSVEIVVPY